MDKHNKSLYKLNLRNNLLKEKEIKNKQVKLILLFNLYENRLVHEKFLDQIFENLIENKQFIRYDFQKKVYSLYPNKIYYNSKISNKLKILSLIGLIFTLLRYVRYKKLIHENFVFLKMYIRIISKIFTLQMSIVFLIVRKNIKLTKIKIYKTCRLLKSLISAISRFLIFNYSDYKVILNKRLSIKNYSGICNATIG